MRALFVIGALLALTPRVPAQGAPVALHVGDSVTQSDLLGYLFSQPHDGDWVRYRISFGPATVEKTIGFGSELVDGKQTPFVEVRVASGAIANSPGAAVLGVGGTNVVKTYVNASGFADLTTRYAVVATVMQVGDSLYRVDERTHQPPEIAANGPLPVFSLLESIPVADLRQGAVTGIAPRDLTVGAATIHATRITAQFPGVPAGEVPPATLVTWQSPDVPLGTVAVRAVVARRELDVTLEAFGRGDYRPVITQALDAVRPLPGAQ